MQLKHHGVKGMRWGIRRFRRSSPRPHFLRKKQRSEENVKMRVTRKKHYSEMSDSELRDTINRMNLERQYRDLTNSEKSRGRKYVEDIVYEVGKELIKSTVRDFVKGRLDERFGE